MARAVTSVLLGFLLVPLAVAGDARAALPLPPPVLGVGPVMGAVAAIATPSSASASSAQPSTSAAAGRAVSIRRASDLEAGLLVRINAVRRRSGLRSLVRSAELERAAYAHVERLAADGYFNHRWPDGAPFKRWILTFYPLGRASYWSAGENLLWGLPAVTPSEAVDAWLASPEHRRNLLEGSWREIGVAVVRVAAAPGFYGGRDVAIAATEFGVRR